MAQVVGSREFYQACLGILNGGNYIVMLVEFERTNQEGLNCDGRIPQSLKYFLRLPIPLGKEKRPPELMSGDLYPELAPLSGDSSQPVFEANDSVPRRPTADPKRSLFSSNGGQFFEALLQCFPKPVNRRSRIARQNGIGIKQQVTISRIYYSDL